MYKYGIVVIGYKNEVGIERLLNALHNADYCGKEIKLIISIDKSDNEKVIEVAQKFQWNYGEKHVITFMDRQGLRNHVLHCGDYLEIYNLDALAVFEDDMMPSCNFFYFMQAATEKYINDENIAGISLYTYCINYNTSERFIPVTNDGDNYFMQCAQSRGQVWFRKQWNEFRNWYKGQEKIKSSYSIPEQVAEWPETSWLKYHIKYCVANDKYFVYPYISYSTCFGEVGEHVKVQTDSLQVPMSNKKLDKFKLIEFDENALKYDAFFENQSLYQYCNINKDDLLIDLYGNHIATDKRYILTKKILPYKIINSWGDKMVPHEMNLIYNVSGEEIILYDLGERRQTVKLPKREEKKNKKEQYFNILDRWMKMEEDGFGIQDYFLKKEWYHIAIYGIGSIGRHLYNRLKKTPIQVDYFIDMNDCVTQEGIEVINPNKQLLFVDAIVVTPVLEFEQIKRKLQCNGIKNVISIDSIFKSME